MGKKLFEKKYQPKLFIKLESTGCVMAEHAPEEHIKLSGSRNENGKISNLSMNSSRAQKRKKDDWPYKHIKFNEQVAVYEVPGYDESRFMSYDDYEVRSQSSCCSIQ